MESSIVAIGIYNENPWFSGIFGGLIFKRTVIGAQEDLEGKTVIDTKYNPC